MASETRLKRWNTLHLDTSEEFIRFFIEQVDNPEGYYTRNFETHAFEVFDQCDYDSNGMLLGKELQQAVLKLLPEVETEKHMNASPFWLFYGEQQQSWKEKPSFQSELEEIH